MSTPAQGNPGFRSRFFRHQASTVWTYSRPSGLISGKTNTFECLDNQFNGKGIVGLRTKREPGSVGIRRAEIVGKVDQQVRVDELASVSAADEEHAGSRSTALCDLKRPAGAVLDGLFGKGDELANIRIGPLDDLDDGLNTCGGKITGHATPSSPRDI